VDNHNLRGVAGLKAGSWLDRIRSVFSARRSQDVTSRAVGWWHAFLCAIAVLNIIAWSLCGIAVTHGHAAGHGEAHAAIHIQLLLSAGYVFGCAFRSVLPVYDIPRVMLVDSWLSSVMVGRSVATVAELCFAAQWALMLHRMALLGHSAPGQAISQVILPIIVLAEICSWHSVLTTSQRGHAAENSIWGVTAALVVVGMLVMLPNRAADLYPPMIAWCVGGAAYVAYIFLFDVPGYWARWIADQASGRRYLSIPQGVIDASRRRIVSHSWEIWKSEVLWMSLYFTGGVWSSISLVYASMALGAH
jgi:hypothetical protein